MATVKSLYFAGKTVNVPHTEHAEPFEKGTVTFDKDGFATVSDTLADSLVVHKPRLIEKLAPTPPKPKSASKSK